MLEIPCYCRKFYRTGEPARHGERNETSSDRAWQLPLGPPTGPGSKTSPTATGKQLFKFPGQTGTKPRVVHSLASFDGFTICSAHQYQRNTPTFSPRTSSLCWINSLFARKATGNPNVSSSTVPPFLGRNRGGQSGTERLGVHMTEKDIRRSNQEPTKKNKSCTIYFAFAVFPPASPGQGLQLPVEPGPHEPGLQVSDDLHGLDPLRGLGQGIGSAGRGVTLVVHGHEV